MASRLIGKKATPSLFRSGHGTSTPTALPPKKRFVFRCTTYRYSRLSACIAKKSKPLNVTFHFVTQLWQNLGCYSQDFAPARGIQERTELFWDGHKLVPSGHAIGKMQGGEGRFAREKAMWFRRQGSRYGLACREAAFVKIDSVGCIVSRGPGTRPALSFGFCGLRVLLASGVQNPKALFPNRFDKARRNFISEAKY